MVKNQKKLFCRVPSFGTRQNKFFAECQTGGTRQRGRRWMPLSPTNLCRVSAFAECPALCKGSLCRVPGTLQRQPLPSAGLYRVPGTRQRQPLPSAGLCRVSYFAECGARQSRSLPSAQNLALGKDFCTRQITCFP